MKSKISINEGYSFTQKDIRVTGGDIVLINNITKDDKQLARVHYGIDNEICLAVLGKALIYKTGLKELRVGNIVNTISSKLELLGICDIEINILKVIN